MDPVVTAIVLASAFMHASWNALVKVDGDRLMAMAVVVGLTAVLSPVLILFIQRPRRHPNRWPRRRCVRVGRHGGAFAGEYCPNIGNVYIEFENVYG